MAGLPTAPHRRYNPLTGQWLLLSPQRTKRPWQGKTEDIDLEPGQQYDPACYLCPGNKRMQGESNEDYQHTFVFDNDFKALTTCDQPFAENEDDLFQSTSVDGTCRVMCFSRRHDLTLAEMEVSDLEKIVITWQDQTAELLAKYTWVQIFENKGVVMGCSNSHPHGQIWASDFIPEEPLKEENHQRAYQENTGNNLLLTYLAKEQDKQQRIVAENEEWICLVPYWAIWPFETLLLPQKHTLRLNDLDSRQTSGLAAIMKALLVRYDNLFQSSFPYSMGWHGAPGGADNSEHWQLHAHYYPPLLRSADIRKFMVGYEMLGCPQRDILPEMAAEMLRSQPATHYKAGGK